MTKVPIRIINKSVEVEVDGRGRGGRGGMGVQRCNSGMITPPLKNHSLPPTPTSLNEHFLKASTSFEDLIHSGINGIKSSIFSSPLPKTNGDSNVSKPPNHLLTGLKELKKYFLLSKSLLSSLSPLKRNSLLLLGVPLLAIPAIWFISFIPLMFCIFAILYSYKFGTIHLIMDIKECIPKNNLISKISFSYLLPSIDFLIIVSFLDFFLIFRT